MVVYSHEDTWGVPFQEKLDILFQQKRNGFFIELGAYDGLIQSNSAFFEFERGWRGMLIEPSFEQYQNCVKSRPNSICIHGACVSHDYKQTKIEGDFLGNSPTASVGGHRSSSKQLTQVNAYTLDSLLEKHAAAVSIDFISIDVEGYELEVLKGLNLKTTRPRFLLIEVYCDKFDEIVRYLDSFSYKLHSNFSNYNKQNNPRWDGLYNDFLFYDAKSTENASLIESSKQ